MAVAGKLQWEVAVAEYSKGRVAVTEVFQKKAAVAGKPQQ